MLSNTEYSYQFIFMLIVYSLIISFINACQSTLMCEEVKVIHLDKSNLSKKSFPFRDWVHYIFIVLNSVVRKIFQST